MSMKFNKFIIVVALFLVVVVITVFVGQRLSSPLAPRVVTPTPVVSKYRGLTPGLSTFGDVIKTLGTPIRKEATGQTDELIYSSGIGDKPTTVRINPDQNVGLVIEPVDNTVRLNDLIRELGQNDTILYGAYYDFGFQLYVYLAHGTALLANPQSGEVKERWHFAPTTLKNFQATYASDFQTQPIPEQQ